MVVHINQNSSFGFSTGGEVFETHEFLHSGIVRTIYGIQMKEFLFYALEKLRSQDSQAAFLMVFIFDTQPWTQVI